MKSLVYLSVCAVLCLPAIAESVDETPDQGQRSCRLLFPERLNYAPKNAYLFDGRTSHRVSLPSMNFSRILELPSGELTLILTTNAVTAPEQIPPHAARLSVAAETDEFYILLSADPDNPQLPVQMRLIDMSGDKLRSGETLWFNQTEHRIIASLGDHEMTVEPQQEIVSEAPIAKSGYYTAKFKYQRESQGDILKITEQQWWHDADSRHLGFISDTQHGRLPKIFFFRDFRM